MQNVYIEQTQSQRETVHTIGHLQFSHIYVLCTEGSRLYEKPLYKRQLRKNYLKHFVHITLLSTIVHAVIIKSLTHHY